jgi:hypothetical protein
LVLSFGNKKKLQEGKCGEYGGWGRISKPQSVSVAIATWDV